MILFSCQSVPRCRATVKACSLSWYSRNCIIKTGAVGLAPALERLICGRAGALSCLESCRTTGYFAAAFPQIWWLPKLTLKIPTSVSILLRRPSKSSFLLDEHRFLLQSLVLNLGLQSCWLSLCFLR